MFILLFGKNSIVFCLSKHDLFIQVASSCEKNQEANLKNKQCTCVLIEQVYMAEKC